MIVGKLSGIMLCLAFSPVLFFIDRSQGGYRESKLEGYSIPLFPEKRIVGNEKIKGY